MERQGERQEETIGIERRMERAWLRGSKSERGLLKEERGRGRAPINFSVGDVEYQYDRTDRISANID